MRKRLDPEPGRLDEAARAGWLYYVAGNKQDEIAQKLGVSRQSAQRLVSLAVSERLIKVRLDHPIAHCMALAETIKYRYGLRSCHVVPSDPAKPFSTTGVSQAGAMEMERHLKSPEPKILGLGTGRLLKACVEQLRPMTCPRHTLVSLAGNMLPDGSATAYNVIIGMAEQVSARHYPMPLPPLARGAAERAMFQEQEPYRAIMELACKADAAFVGIGEMTETCPMLVDGFITHDEMRALRAAGAAGEMTGWVFDCEGVLIEGLTNERVTSAPLKTGSEKPVCGIAAGQAKIPAIRAAAKGGLITSLITNEATGDQLVQE